MEIRHVTADERLTTMFPLGAYAFSPSPWTETDVETFRSFRPYQEDIVNLVAQEDGETLACAAAHPMRQNVRGVVLPMAGIASVASHPSARRRGLVRTLLWQLLREMRDAGRPVSSLYPFRPSFYERFGFVGLPRVRTTTFPPAGLAHLLRAELPGTVSRVHVREGYAEHRALVLRLLKERHGFAVFSDTRAASMGHTQDRWVAIARADDGVAVGAVAYRVDQHGGDLIADDLLVTGPLGRALLLQYFARHVDQVGRIVMAVGADEMPELWGTDLAAHTEADVRFPQSPAPMARVLSVDGLAGLAVGAGRGVGAGGAGRAGGRALPASGGRWAVGGLPGPRR
jgi:predicted N-acetyltransferase YhbS